MNIKKLHPGFRMPERSTSGSGGYDLFMPEGGLYEHGKAQQVHSLGFSAEVPEGYVALLLPRSGVGFVDQLEINNTCGVIDSDYRGEWKAKFRTKTWCKFSWNTGDRLLQMLIVPVSLPDLVLVDELDDTARGAGGLGSSGR